jgi:fumarate hydratase, class II
VFALRLIKDLDVNRELLAANVANALLLPTVLNPVLGYDRVAQITTKALKDGIPPREAALALGFLTGEEYDRLVDARAMATPSDLDGARPVAGKDRDDRRR